MPAVALLPPPLEKWRLIHHPSPTPAGEETEALAPVLARLDQVLVAYETVAWAWDAAGARAYSKKDGSPQVILKGY
ncbi:MAG: hypothetical protein P9G45_14970 [Candidatus Contendobacter sp.]|nr:hypothetical protein [Candidatus Contendobacter sp.]